MAGSKRGGSGFWRGGAYATMGFGGSLCSSAAQGMALLDVPAARMGHASALWNINRQLAFCLGMAVLGGLLNLLQARADAAFVHCPVRRRFHAIASAVGEAYRFRRGSRPGPDLKGATP